MFSTAKKIAPKKSAKKEKNKVAIDGIANYAAIDAVIKSLTALRETMGADVKSAMQVEFIKEGCAAKKRPENFTGTDEGATASCELRIRATSSALTADEIALAEKNGISTQEIEGTIETYVINPAYKDDGALLQQVEKKLKGIKGIPEDFIMFQEGTKKTVVAPTALDEVFAMTPERARDLLSLVGVMAIKAKLDDEDVSKAFELVSDLI